MWVLQWVWEGTVHLYGRIYDWVRQGDTDPFRHVRADYYRRQTHVDPQRFHEEQLGSLSWAPARLPRADLINRARSLEARLDDVAELQSGDESQQVDRRTVYYRDALVWARHILRSTGRALYAGGTPLIPGRRSAKDRAILGTLVAFGPSPVVAVAQSAAARIRFLHYDWSLNDVRTNTASPTSAPAGAVRPR